jgi:translation initiation factor IF-2
MHRRVTHHGPLRGDLCRLALVCGAPCPRVRGDGTRRAHPCVGSRSAPEGARPRCPEGAGAAGAGGEPGAGPQAGTAASAGGGRGARAARPRGPGRPGPADRDARAALHARSEGRGAGAEAAGERAARGAAGAGVAGGGGRAVGPRATRAWAAGWAGVCGARIGARAPQRWSADGRPQSPGPPPDAPRTSTAPGIALDARISS